MFERPQSGERAILLHASPSGTPDPNEREEFAELAASAGAVIVDQLVSSRRRPDSRYFIGKGKLDDLKKSVEENGAVQSGSAGLSCFLVRVRGEDGELNALRVANLKDKLGTHQLPTAELELQGTRATWLTKPMQFCMVVLRLQPECNLFRLPGAPGWAQI